ncbi:MAG TPA: PLP-dependent aminotransferase family protein, partial [Kiloniellales bacterium]|nr:PLP-dependent aminotransferase family protein [Kiloniellales bacterium]
MSNWDPDPTALTRPVYQSLVRQIVRAVEDGRLAPGERLPTHRSLAHRLGVSVQTVGRAYEALIQRGVIVGEVGRGTFVRPDKLEPAPPFILERGPGAPIDLSILKPVGDPRHVERAGAALQALAADLPPRCLFSFRPSLLQKDYRETAVGWLARCGVTTTAENIQLTNGATGALTVALLAAARVGGLVATEAIGHHTLRALAGYLGFRLLGMVLDDEGIVPEALDEACRSHDVKALFVLPSCCNPTVTMVGAERRAALVEVARRHDLLIIENDAWGPLVEDRPAPFAALAPERTLYVTSLTKCVLPGLRVGFLVVPEMMISAVANRHLVTNWLATPLVCELASRWIADGTAWELVGWQRQALRSRHALAAEVLDPLPAQSQRDSLHIWLSLPPAWREEEFVAHA